MSTQRSKKRARRDSDGEFEQTQATQAGSSSRGDPAIESEIQQEERQRKISNVVRYALASEMKRRPMRREDINKSKNQKKINRIPSFHALNLLFLCSRY